LITKEGDKSIKETISVIKKNPSLFDNGTKASLTQRTARG